MRLAFALLCVAGCIRTYSDPDPGPDPDPGWTGPQGTPIYGCTKDADCDTEICARDGECYPATSIIAAHVTWTVRGQVADATSCASSVNLYIRFSSSTGNSFGYAPVPCRNGLFTIDKLANTYTMVELGSQNSSIGTTGVIDRVTGNVTIDLP